MLRVVRSTCISGSGWTASTSIQPRPTHPRRLQAVFHAGWCPEVWGPSFAERLPTPHVAIRSAKSAGDTVPAHPTRLHSIMVDDWNGPVSLSCTCEVVLVGVYVPKKMRIPATTGTFALPGRSDKTSDHSCDSRAEAETISSACYGSWTLPGSRATGHAYVLGRCLAPVIMKDISHP